MTNRDLWAKIQAYSFDSRENIAQTFAQRLAHEQGWTLTFARGAIQEYRKVIYLASTADHAVTPSREVDEVWHLHLTYSRSYWERLMPLLPRVIHHEPTDGGDAQDAHFFAQYQRTLDLYEATFGERPPPEYWPSPAVRFAPVPARTSPQPVVVTMTASRTPAGVMPLTGIAMGFVVIAVITLIFGGSTSAALVLLLLGLTSLTIAISIDAADGQSPSRSAKGSGSTGHGASFGCGTATNHASGCGSSGCGSSGCGSGCGGGGCGS